MSDRFNSTIQADTRSWGHRFFDQEVLGRVNDLVENRVLNPFRRDSLIPRAISPATELAFGVRADAPFTWGDTAAVALGVMVPEGKAVKAAGAAKGPLMRVAKSVAGLFGKSRKVASAEKKLAGLTKEADIVEKSFDTAVKTYEKSGAATLRNSKLDTAVRKSFEEIKNRQLGPLKAKVESQKALIARLTEKSRRAAEAAADPAATATAKRLDAIKAANKGLRTSAMDPSDYAKTVMREARKQVTAGEPGSLATFIKGHPKAAFGLKWGAITGVPIAAYEAYATTSESRKDAAAAKAVDAKKAALDAVIADGWDSVTNSAALAAAYDDTAVTRNLMRRAQLVASEQVRLLGNDEDAKKVQQAKAVDTMIKVADVLRESDAWDKGLAEFDSKLDESAERLAEEKLRRLPSGTDWNQVYEDSRRELMNLPDEDKVLGGPYYPPNSQNGGPQ